MTYDQLMRDLIGLEASTYALLCSVENLPSTEESSRAVDFLADAKLRIEEASSAMTHYCIPEGAE